MPFRMKDISYRTPNVSFRQDTHFDLGLLYVFAVWYWVAKIKPPGFWQVYCLITYYIRNKHGPGCHCLACHCCGPFCEAE